MKRVFAIVLAMLLLVGAMPVSAMAASKKTVYISSTGSGSMNMRKGPGKDYGVAGFVYHGDKVTVLDESGIWSKVRNEDGVKGWIKTKYIDGTTKDLGTGTKTVKTSGGSLNLRTGPGTDYGSRGKVYDGARIKVLNTEGAWVRVRVESTGSTGWIMEKYVSGSGSSGSSSSSGDTLKVYHVTSSTLNVRSGPGSDYSWKATLNRDQGFKVLSSSGNWYKVKTFSGVTGWLSKTYTASGASAKVTAGSLNMRSKASTSGSIIKSLGYGARVTVNSVTGNWARISHGGSTGYVSLNYLSF